ncbi:unnamed protein product [Cyclocybe aegerita]|uniref:Telomere length regulation protein conserved domain-containing protein n=1 Tax=Cyclocybe aegerita TaxID=1973307 RepID=A0A8S0XPB0_CYCAE|nr:unnamed protein product [Cyclocybe aegerita]
MEEPDPRTQIQELLTALQSPIADLPTLLGLLTAPLDALGILPPRFKRYNTRPLPAHSLNVSKHVPHIQRAALTHIAPTWGAALREDLEGGEALLDQYFCPDAMVNARQEAGDMAREAYATLVVSPVLAPGIGLQKNNEWTTGFALGILEKLVVGYPVDRMYKAVFSAAKEKGKAKGKGKGLEEVGWEECVRNVCMVPAKVANAIAGKREVPDVLENAVYFGRLGARCEVLVRTLAGAKEDKNAIPALAYLLQKLVNLGVFPPKQPVARSQPSFFQATLPAIRARFELDTPESSSYSKFWSALLLALPSLTLQSILASLFGTLSTIDPPTDTSQAKRVLAKRDAALLDGLVGKVAPPQEKGLEEEQERAELWEIATSLILGREWPESYARTFVCWVSGGAKGTRVNLKALDAFLEAVVEIWASPEHIKHSLLSRHRYMTSLLLITVSYFPPSSQHVDVLVSMPSFIQAISMYISHLDPSVRRCGMLAAEDVARLCGKKLEFGGWGEQDAIGVWARAVRELMKARDVDAKLEVVQREKEEEVEEVAAPAGKEGLAVAEKPEPELATKATFVEKDGYDSDDSMTGYASPPSSRSASPTPSELAEIEKDPTLNVGVQKVPRPVYLAQLGDLLRAPPKQGTKEPHEADKIEMALNCAEELVRKKSGYGSELDENAVNLVYALLGLQDNYELEGFAEKRQGALTALVACAPRKATSCLIEEFFKNQYSTDQRFVALNALAVGARELASLHVSPSRLPPERTAFPSKMLPGPLHQKYIAAGKANTELIPLLMDDISKKALDGARASVDNEPSVIRERRLRIQKLSGVTEVTRPLNSFAQMQAPIQKPATRFIDVAAEYFVMPLINRFWMFLRDEQAREERTALFEGRGRYYGVGTGLILNPLVLAQFLWTLAILVNASQNAPEWLAIIAPDSLELAVTIGTRPVSHLELDEDLKDGIDLEEETQKKEASVLISALELALVVLDGALEIDGGKIMGLEHTTLVLSLGEWAGKVFASLEKGLKVQGGGGIHEAKLSRAAAGVLLKVDELTSKWRRSMLDTR